MENLKKLGYSGTGVRLIDLDREKTVLLPESACSRYFRDIAHQQIISEDAAE
ncbi:MAG: hypothetical protein L0956_06390 [Candidatus Mariimomonas ferrooxydans]